MNSCASIIVKLSLIVIFCSFLPLFNIVGVSARPQEKEYGLRLQPELDIINVDEYLKNEKLMDLQLKCILENGACDIVGRWVKPRVAAAFLGGCPLCTEIQKKNVMKIIAYMQEKRPNDYRRAIIKYLKSSGIDVDTDAAPVPSSSASPVETEKTSS